MTGVSTNTAHGRVVAAAATRAASALLDLDFALVDPTGKNTQCGKAFERLLFRPVCFGVLVGGGIAYPSEQPSAKGRNARLRFSSVRSAVASPGSDRRPTSRGLDPPAGETRPVIPQSGPLLNVEIAVF